MSGLVNLCSADPLLFIPMEPPLPQATVRRELTTFTMRVHVSMIEQKQLYVPAVGAGIALAALHLTHSLTCSTGFRVAMLPVAQSLQHLLMIGQ